jgi:hypothetical protein
LNHVDAHGRSARAGRNADHRFGSIWRRPSNSENKQRGRDSIASRAHGEPLSPSSGHSARPRAVQGTGAAEMTREQFNRFLLQAFPLKPLELLLCRLLRCLGRWP